MPEPRGGPRLLVAGVTKLADRAGSRQGLIDFGVPAGLATPFGILSPKVELAVAIYLVAVATAWWGAAVALALLLRSCSFSLRVSPST